MAMRLITTCNSVKAAVDIPRIMAMTMLLPSVPGHRLTGDRVWRIAPQQIAPRIARGSSSAVWSAVAVTEAAARRAGQRVAPAPFLDKPGWRSTLHDAFRQALTCWM